MAERSKGQKDRSESQVIGFYRIPVADSKQLQLDWCLVAPLAGRVANAPGQPGG
jgi:hypothetical protein